MKLYMNVEEVGRIIKSVIDEIEENISKCKASNDQIGRSLRSLEYCAVSRVRQKMMVEGEVLTAEQVAAENAEEMVNDMAEEASE